MRFLGSRLVSGIAIVATCGLMTSGAAQAVTYSFTRIADTTTAGPSGMLDENALGDASASGSLAAFHSCYGGGSGCGIFRGDGNALTAIVKDGDAAPTGTFTSDFTFPPPFGPLPFARSPAISGTNVAFYADYVFNEVSGVFEQAGIFRGAGSGLTTIVKTGDAAPVGSFSTFSDASISGATVAFRGGYGVSQGVFLGNGGPLTTIAKSGDVVPSVGAITGVGAPALSGATAAFAGNYSGGQGIFTGSGGALTVVAKTGDAAPVGTFDATGFSDPTISGSMAAFRATYNSNAGSGIFKGGGVALTTVVKVGDPAPIGTFSFLSTPSIGLDSVAFVGNYGSQHAIFVGDGGPLTTVIRKGDVLFGSTINSIVFDKFGFDPSGNLAFTYTLVNGRTGVALAVRGGPPTGDFNRNGAVDAADFVLWRDTLGLPVDEGLGADANFNGVIDPGDNLIWKSNFGRQAEGGSGSMEAKSVPEPAAGSVALVAAVCIALVVRLGARTDYQELPNP
jgi:hypothetical protein